MKRLQEQKGAASADQEPSKFPGKKSKRQYIGLNRPISDWPKIVNDIDRSVYKKFIIELLKTRGNVKPSESEKYLDKYGMDMFVKAMTHDSVDPLDRANNYEMMEHLGDITVNKCIAWYLKNRFPDLYSKGDTSVGIFSRQEGLLKSKPNLAGYSEKLGFPAFVRYRPLEFKITKESKGGVKELGTKTVNLDNSMKEDAFEAFMCCLEDVVDTKEGFPGIGYSICFRIMTSVLDEEQIPTSLRDLVDDKTKLKEVLDKRKPEYDKMTKKITKPGDKWEWDNQNKEITLTLTLGYDRPVPVVLKYGPMSTAITGYDDAETSGKQIMQKLSKDALSDLAKRYGNAYEYRKGE